MNPFATGLFEQLTCHLAFIGCNGVDVRGGVTNRNVAEAEIKRAMVRTSRRAIVVADASKLGEVEVARVCGIDEVDLLITDSIGRPPPGGRPDERRADGRSDRLTAQHVRTVARRRGGARGPDLGGGPRRKEENMRIPKSVAVGVGLVIALSACSSTTSSGGSSASPSASTGGGETVALTWRTRPDNQAEADVYKKISDEITAKNIGLKLTYQAGNSEGSPYQDKLKTELAAGTAPDVFWIPGTDVADFAKQGLILNFASQAQSQGLNKSDFYDGPIEALSVDPASGKPSDTFLWGIPRDVSTFALYLNLDLIDKAGVEDPRELAKNGNWTWDKFLATAQAITSKGGAGVKGFGANSWWANWGYFVNSGGGSFFKDDRTACNLDAPGSDRGPDVLQGPVRQGPRGPVRRGRRARLQVRQGRHVPQRSLGHPGHP